jgi:hypothetical protein
MKQTSWGNTNFTSSLPLFHIISFSTFHLCSYNKANNSWIYIIRCLSTIPTMHKEQWLTWHKTFAFFICAKNQLWAKTQTDRVNGCRPSLLQLGLGLGFKDLVVPWRGLFLLRLRLVVVGVRWSAFYFVCASSSGSGRFVAGVCLGSRCSSGNYTARYYHCFNSLFASFAFLFSCFFVAHRMDPLWGDGCFFHANIYVLRESFVCFLPPILFDLLLLYCCLLPVFHVPCVDLSGSRVPFVLVHIFS